MTYTTYDQAKAEAEAYFVAQFPGENINNYSGHNDELDAFRHA